MTDTVCGYSGDRDGALVAYLYDDINPIERASLEAHLATCARCRTELDELGGLRTQLGTWAPPEPARAFAYATRSAGERPAGLWSRLGEIPAWAQVAAALLVLGVSAGIANLDVRYGPDGLTVRTGWSNDVARGSSRAPSVDEAARLKPRATPEPRAPTDAQWRADLAALEQQLRGEFRAADAASRTAMARTAAAPGGPGVNDAELMRRIRVLIADSERKQQSELALRIAGVFRDVTAQRNADLVRIDRSLGIVQSNTGVEVAKQRELLNYLVRVSSQK